MGTSRMSLPIELILDFHKNYALSTFVEIKTGSGETSGWASQCFNQVITIESSNAVYQNTKKRYANVTNIDFLFGNTKSRLAEVIDRLGIPALFWLNDHWSEGETQDECFLLEQLEIINRSSLQHFILIDHARLFTAPPPRPYQAERWADINTVLQQLNAGQFERYIVIYEDTIIAVPTIAKSSVVEYCQKQSSVQSLLEPIEEIEMTGEADVIGNLTFLGNVFFDIGANKGQWAKAVLRKYPNAQIHAFEPVPQTYQLLLRNLTDFIKVGKVCPVSLAVSDREAIRTFHSYESISAWSSLYRRREVEQQENISPTPFKLLTTTLDQYCQQWNIRHIHFLKIDVEGGELEVLWGAKELLRTNSIDYIQFEYGGTWKDAKFTLEEAFQYLHQFQYSLFKILPSGLEYKPVFLPEYEDFEYSNFLAISHRFVPYFFNEEPKMFDLKTLCDRYGIIVNSVIQVGAHEGEEITQYQKMNVQGALLIEANPFVFERLETNLEGIDNMVAIQGAISDRTGSVTLHITSEDQSGSILPLKKHQELYPEVRETAQIEVLTTTLDGFLEEFQLNPEEFNFLDLDIQGAELLALKGATNLLQHIQAINTEVNYEELYEGCALIHEIDDFLSTFGFERVETTTPYHPSWGDAFYVKKPIITMSTLGSNGRFANQFFQYLFLKTYAKIHRLRVETSPWIGQFLFGHIDPPITCSLPVVGSPDDLLPDLANALTTDREPPYQNVEFWGYFQYHTRYYAPHRDYIRSLFEPRSEVKDCMEIGFKQLKMRGKTIVGLHLRRGDYGYGYFYIAPSQWYLDWLDGFWETLDDPVLFIASDEPEKVVSDFAKYHPITAQDLGVILPEAPFYLDFYLLSQCDIVAISNSSFSFAACLLNARASLFFRPHLTTQKLIPFDPWNSEPLLKDAMVEDQSDE